MRRLCWAGDRACRFAGCCVSVHTSDTRFSYAFKFNSSPPLKSDFASLSLLPVANNLLHIGESDQAGDLFFTFGANSIKLSSKIERDAKKWNFLG